MRRLLVTIDRWGPAAVSVIALFIVSVMLWWYSERIARLEGMVQSQRDQLNACQNVNRDQTAELSGVNKWLVSVWAKLESEDVKPPPKRVTKE